MPAQLVLHWSPRSPYVRKTTIAVHEMGLTDRVRTVRTVVGGTAQHAELMKINPLGKIPTLEIGDGTVIYNSPVVIEYLDFRFSDLSWRTGHPKLAAWHETFNARPSVLANPVVDDR